MGAGDGDLVSVAHAPNRVEAEMIRGLLESAGIPSVLQQVGIDGPQLGIGVLNPAGGSRRVLVHADRAQEARALLRETPAGGEPATVEAPEAAYAEDFGGREPRNYGLIGAYARIWAWSLGLIGLAFAVFLLLRGA